MKKLGDLSAARQLLRLRSLGTRSKLGPVLWQLPPNLGLIEERLITFCELLPRTTERPRLAEHHDERITDDRALTTARVRAPVRHAMEVRHPTLASDRAIDDPART